MQNKTKQTHLHLEDVLLAHPGPATSNAAAWLQSHKRVQIWWYTRALESGRERPRTQQRRRAARERLEARLR
jgi:hypothetical protein